MHVPMGRQPLTILVGIDGSPTATRALDRALALSGPGDRIVAVTAVPVGEAGAERIGEATESARAEGEATLAAAAEHAAAREIRLDTALGEGDPIDVLVDAVGRFGASVLVVGARRLGAAERIVLGSVSSGVLHRAPCDVLIVH